MALPTQLGYRDRNCESPQRFLVPYGEDLRQEIEMSYPELCALVDHIEKRVGGPDEVNNIASRDEWDIYYQLFPQTYGKVDNSELGKELAFMSYVERGGLFPRMETSYYGRRDLADDAFSKADAVILARNLLAEA